MKQLILIFLLILIRLTGFGQYATEIVVDKEGNGDFLSIQAALNATKAFPEKHITIFIKKGIYREKVMIYSWNNNLTLKGEHKDSTIIRWGDHFKKMNLGRNSTFHTYTLKVQANDVSIQNLTIENEAGAVGQAIALHLEGDRIQVENCTINGNQDTLYVAGEGSRQYFQNCNISGTTDFIFGEATAVFSSCNIISKSNSYITAASTPKTQPYGLTFIDCKLTKINEGVTKVYLGRPWRSYAKTVFINCELGEHIVPSGWDNWGSREKEMTAFYGEYGSTGRGAGKKRVQWSHQLTKLQASDYTMSKIFNDWTP